VAEWKGAGNTLTFGFQMLMLLKICLLNIIQNDRTGKISIISNWGCCAAEVISMLKILNVNTVQH